MSKALLDQIKKAHKEEKVKANRYEALENKGVQIEHFGDEDNIIGVTKMDTFLNIAKGIDADITVNGDDLNIKSGDITIFITPECDHMKQMNKRVFKIIK